MTMAELFVIISAYCVGQAIIGSLIICITSPNEYNNLLDFCVLNPIQLYKKTRLNRFGSWCVAIFLWIIFTPWAIGYWIYKTFTIGK